MPITPKTDKWLSDAGYEYHCFISWAHTQSKDMTDFAKIIKQEIQQKLALSFSNPKVFLEEQELAGGAIWEKVIHNSLCRSVSMIALCAPIYYHPNHKWCGIEWASMSNLGNKRLPKENFGTIIPLLIRHGELPDAVSCIQYVDFSPVVVRGRSFYRSLDYQKKINHVVERIEAIAQALEQNNSVPQCDEFDLPSVSAFHDYEAKTFGLPFRGI